MERLLKKSFLTMAIALFSVIAFAKNTAEPNAKYVSGKEYIEVTVPSGLPLLSTEKNSGIQVVEFFSYGCPHCGELEPVLEKWLKSKPENVQFYRIPVEWFRGWDNLGKAYFVAEQLKVTDKVNMALFDAVQNKKINPNDVKAIAAVFQEHAGISNDVFMKTFDSFGVNVSQTRGQQWVAGYKVRGVPTLVVDGRFLTDAAKAGSVETLPDIINYLVNLAAHPVKAQ